MVLKSLARNLIVVAFALISLHSLGMPEGAREWMMRMTMAGEQHNYKGNMIGIRGDNVEMMGIVHRVDEEGQQERIFSLNGSPREIIRKSGELICYLPDKEMGLQSKLFNQHRFFPDFTDLQINKLSEYYEFKLTGEERIVNRDSQLLEILPKDEYRYGYKLWIDKATGLLLKSAFVDHQGSALESYMFTEIEVNVEIADSELEPSEAAKAGLNWTQIPPMPETYSPSECKFEGIPVGFAEVHSVVKPASDKQNMMSQYVFSDGLSNFSLFIERMYQADDMDMQGAYQLGNVSAYSRVLDGDRITMMGEVPSVTAKKVAMAVSNCQ